MIPEHDRIQTVMTTAEIAAAMEGGDYSAEMLLQHLVRRYNELEDRAESWRMSSVCRAKEAEIARLESELEHHKHDAKAWSAVAKGYLGERNDARAEIEQIKAVLADPLAVHLNMLRGTIQWTPANLRHLLGDGSEWAELCPPPSTEERRDNARAIQAMTPQERFALMFQQKPTDDQAGG